MGEGTLNFGQQSSLPFAGRFPGTCGEECLLKCRQYYLLGILFYHNLLLSILVFLIVITAIFIILLPLGARVIFFFQVWRRGSVFPNQRSLTAELEAKYSLFNNQ